ncbi:hypothetical protein HQQ94_16750 [Shewanella sp. VB17]|uniref:hypothetical protein n=1 Tax=Shewanella sp. VB17 TaxID=2739432 RepID=UPI0015639CAB|nr:hypothetical protein [Shewanella sp. VB17]NRD74838.1 hypothetical protein [Shewanella sp. VB17]
MFSLIVQGANNQSIKLAFPADPDSNVNMKWAELIYTDAFLRININFSYIVLPVVRASRMTDSGVLDGEALRVEHYGLGHPNLIRIEEPISTTHIGVFASNPLIEIKSWQDVVSSQYKIDYYRGNYLVPKRLSQSKYPDNINDSSAPIDSLHKLGRGRIDLYIAADRITNDVLNTPEFADKKIKMITTLEKIHIYGYLHQRHSELTVRLADIFRKMKVEGKFEEYLKQANQFMASQTVPK